MAIIEATSSARGKCVSCFFYRYEGNVWISGRCANKEAKVRRRHRWYNDKACVRYRDVGMDEKVGD